MPPSPLYNWLCVLYSASEILSRAASIRAAQIARTNAELQRGLCLQDTIRRPNPSRASGARHACQENAQKDAIKKVNEHAEPKGLAASAKIAASVVSSQTPDIEHPLLQQEPCSSSSGFLVQDRAKLEKHPPISEDLLQKSEPNRQFTSASKSEVPAQVPGVSVDARTTHVESKIMESELLPSQTPPLSQTQRNLQASRVPSSRIGRLFHYGGLAASLGYGAASEALRRVSSSQHDEEQSSLMMTRANIKRLVEKLSKMRGAALKLGQLMSIQDTHMLPKDVEEVFRRVQDSAHYMPNWQMERVMSGSLGHSWESNFASFDRVPFAAASLGQVHSAILAGHTSPTGKEEKVAIKIQFPDIEKSIDSDLSYLKLLLNAGKILPKGLFLDKTLQVMKGELAEECDYTREASCARFFGSQDAVGKDSRFKVPWVWEGSTERVLVMQQMEGVSVGGQIVDKLSQDSRDQIASSILELCMKELFDLRMMQTDPNWSNFLWNERTRQIELIDFGATRSYSKQFIDKWMRILQAAVSEDRDACMHWSLELGYLTGKENKTMLDAHIRSITLLATPFRNAKTNDGRYVFGRGTEWARITAEIRSLIPVMLRERLTPPPRETYSLNRKLSGAFLLASRLSARVHCNAIWDETVDRYQFSDASSS